MGISNVTTTFQNGFVSCHFVHAYNGDNQEIMSKEDFNTKMHLFLASGIVLDTYKHGLHYEIPIASQKMVLADLPDATKEPPVQEEQQPSIFSLIWHALQQLWNYFF